MNLRELCEALCVRLTIGGPLMEAPLNRGTGFRRPHRTSRLDVSDVRQTVALLRTQLRQAGRMTTR